MRLTLTFLFGFSLFLGRSQNQKTGILLDNETKAPLEFVSVYNAEDYTVSNADGRFEFTSEVDSVIFYRVSYQKLAKTFSQLKDTVLLSKSVFELNEVVVTNAKTIYQKIKDSINTNYLLKPHSETFFLRAILKKNGTITRIQDIQGELKRKTSIYGSNLELEKKDFQIEIQNMRKIGISKDENDIYFTFPTLYNVFSEFVRINAMGPNFEVTEQPSVNELTSRVNFNSNVPEASGKTVGYYILNSYDNAILAFDVNVIPFVPATKNSKKITSRLLLSKQAIFFKEDPNSNLYFMNSAKREAKLKVTGPNNSFSDTYEMSIILTTSSSFGTKNIKSNINEQKDMFKLKFPYNPNYWNFQNQLLLTDEMQEFIKKMGDENTAFKIKTNMN